MIAALVTAGLLAACAGSCAVTASLRWLRGEQAIHGRSRCDHCGTTLGLASTVPVVSYVALGGRCAACRARIDPVHLIAEAFAATACVLAFAVIGGLPALLVSLMALVLVSLGVIDGRVQRLPDGLTACALALAVTLAALRGELWLGLAVGLAMAGGMAGLRLAFRRAAGRQGFGLGDVKLIGALSVWTGLASPWALAAASALGLAFVLVRRPADRRIAFGPFLCAAYFAIGFCQEAGWWRSAV